MSRFENPAIKRRVREYALTGPVRPTEVFTLVGNTDDAAEREELYQWITANYDALMKKLPPTYTTGIGFIASGCEPDRVERARQFFAEKKVTGTERSLARVAEQVNDCAALRTREIEAVTRYLTAGR
jgi:hypothetical protein